MNPLPFRSLLLAALSLFSATLAFAVGGAAEAPPEIARFQDPIAKQVEAAVKAAGDLEASQKASYRKILEEYLAGALPLRLELLKVSLADEPRNASQGKELKKRLVRLSKAAYGEADDVLKGKALKGARAYFRSQARQSSVYEDAAKSWRAFEKELAAAKLEDRQLEELKLSVLPFFVKYHAALSGSSFTFGESGASDTKSGEAVRERILKASKVPKAVAKDILTAEQLDVYYAAITETTRVAGSGRYVSTVRRL